VYSLRFVSDNKQKNIQNIKRGRERIKGKKEIKKRRSKLVSESQREAIDVSFGRSVNSEIWSWKQTRYATNIQN
jgi:hypothetical protein